MIVLMDWIVSEWQISNTFEKWMSFGMLIFYTHQTCPGDNGWHDVDDDITEPKNIKSSIYNLSDRVCVCVSFLFIHMNSDRTYKINDKTYKCPQGIEVLYQFL